MMKIILTIGLITLLAGQLYSSHGQEKSLKEPSPRAFCQATDGTLSETGIEHAFLCCYPKKRKCMLSNTRMAYSKLILLDIEKTRVK